MASTNYALTSDEIAALGAALAGPPFPGVAAQITSAQGSRLTALTAHQNKLTQNAYMDVLTHRSPPVIIPAGASFARQTISGQDSLVVTS